MDQNLDFVIHTFGCKVNTYDTGLIQKNMNQNGFNLLSRVEKNKAQIHILNTCAVTAEATQEAVKTIRRIKSKQPFSTVVVTGCSAQVDTGAFENLVGADLIIANSHKGLIPDLIRKFYKRELTERVFKSNIFKKEDLEAGGGLEQSHTRSFLKIQDGCNSFCTFCIIPYARGKSRSIGISDLVTRIKDLEIQGRKEIVLTGVHIGDYEDIQNGNKKTLEDLVETILAKTTISRIRLSSLEPVELTDRLLDLYSDPRMCPHFHMSIQSANTEVLFQMKRKYTQSDVTNALHKIYSKLKNPFVGMDVIAGFPTETSDQFDDTYKILCDLPWTKMHVFPYSERQGTRAAAFDQIPFHVRKERASTLRSLSQHRYHAELLKQIGALQEVLILNDEMTYNGVIYREALTKNYWPVLVPQNQSNRAGTEQKIKIINGTQIDSDYRLMAEGVSL
ncbi:MAG: tRNA (N(6)-L-threonylcarbamoyladenosine(37)-C(2))-methylthiotransferase MtaB [Moraxellaceae bacterium]|nr:tRNA (N(6)-L-threonylcarbamoyladenosine(37)-C(2))-methylthiotransferase MtaB [Pseudobdellovibrionaceae bacterium]